MKMLRFYLAGVACLLFLQLSAQMHFFREPREKPALFTHLPDSLLLERFVIEQLFAASPDAIIRIPVTGSVVLTCKLRDRIQRNAQVISLNLVVLNFQQALLNISRFTSDNGNHFAGRLVHAGYSDVLLLDMAGDRLLLRKQKQSLFLVE